MKTYNQTNFFKHTFCEFQQVDNFEFPEDTIYKSKSESMYFYDDEGVYRKSNHWGRVANCRWKIISSKGACPHIKNQQTVIGFAKWADFYPINSSKKLFCIAVDFKNKTAKLQPKKEKNKAYLFTFSEAQKKLKQINHLLNDYKWAKYFDVEITELRFKLITEFINSQKTLQEIKSQFK